MTDQNGDFLAGKTFNTNDEVKPNTMHIIDDSLGVRLDDNTEKETDSQLIYYMGIFLSGAVVIFVFVVLIIIVIKNKARPRTLRNPTLVISRPTTKFWHNSSYKERCRSGLTKSTFDMFKEYEL